MSVVLLWKWGFIFGWKVCFTTKKGVHFELKSQCFITKKGSFWAQKSVFCCKEGGNFQTKEQGWVPLFPVSEGAGVWSFHQIQLTCSVRLIYNSHVLGLPLDSQWIEICHHNPPHVTPTPVSDQCIVNIEDIVECFMQIIQASQRPRNRLTV